MKKSLGKKLQYTKNTGTAWHLPYLSLFNCMYMMLRIEHMYSDLLHSQHPPVRVMNNENHRNVRPHMDGDVDW